jgi:adenine-specific DNA-methyltransferase
MKVNLKRSPARRNGKAKRSSLRLVKEQEQLYLVGAPAKAKRNEPEKIIGRYHQNGTAEKKLGAVYTPPRVAAALTRWAVRSSEDCVLDPACGEGVFLSAARTRLADLGARKPQCIGVDIDSKTATFSGAICSDFFKWVKNASPVDVIVGNPPFIRSHLFPEDSRILAFAEMVRLGLRPSRLMSTWSPFLALCSSKLRKNGRLAMVIPEELLHVGYAEELRRFLLTQFRRVIVCLPSRGIWHLRKAIIALWNQPTFGTGIPNGLTCFFPLANDIVWINGGLN